MTRAQSRVGAVVLTYNSADDLPDCLAGLRAQRGVDLQVIVVDNASKLDERARMKAIFHEVLPEGLILAAKPLPTPTRQPSSFATMLTLVTLLGTT